MVGPPGEWAPIGSGYFDDYQRDYEVAAYRVGVVRPPRVCPKGLHEVPSSFDYCGQCGEFFPDTYFCRLCNTPTQKSLAERGLCRGRFAFTPCDADNKGYIAKTTDPKWSIGNAFRFGPSNADKANAALRYKRLENRRADSRGGNSAFAVSFAVAEPAEAFPRERQRSFPSKLKSTPPTHSTNPSASEVVAALAVATAPCAQRELGSHPELTAGAKGLG